VFSGAATVLLFLMANEVEPRECSGVLVAGEATNGGGK
jgi:hypothetical protein